MKNPKSTRLYAQHKCDVKVRTNAYGKTFLQINPTRERLVSRNTSRKSCLKLPQHSKAISRESSRKSYAKNVFLNQAASRDCSRKSYAKNVVLNRPRSRDSSRKSYAKNVLLNRARSRKNYSKNLLLNRTLSRDCSRKSYAKNVLLNRALSRDCSRRSYAQNCVKSRVLSKHSSMKSYLKNPERKKKMERDRYRKNAEGKKYSGSRNSLAEPTNARIGTILKCLETKLLTNKTTRTRLLKAFKNVQQTSTEKLTTKVSRIAACKIAVSRILQRALQVRRKLAGGLLADCRSIKKVVLNNRPDFGVGRHTASTEPYFYDAAYHHVKRDHALPIDNRGTCVLAKPLVVKGKDEKDRYVWMCTSECKPLSTDEIDMILSFRSIFEKPITKVRKALQSCDNGCPHIHNRDDCHSGRDDLVWHNNDGKCCSDPRTQGHPLPCYSSDSKCSSKLRILGCAAIHYEIVATFLRHLTYDVSTTCFYDMFIVRSAITLVLERLMLHWTKVISSNSCKSQGLHIQICLVMYKLAINREFQIMVCLFQSLGSLI